MNRLPSGSECSGVVFNIMRFALHDGRRGRLAANEYVARDGRQAVLFAFLHAQQYGRTAPAIRLAGLNEQAVYRLRPLYGTLAEPLETASGAALMYRGLSLQLKGEFDGAAVVLERVD